MLRFHVLPIVVAFCALVLIAPEPVVAALRSPDSPPEPDRIHQVQTGEDLDIGTLVENLSNVEVVYAGERHDQPTARQRFLQLARDLHEIHDRQVVLALEILRQDQQEIIDAWMETSEDPEPLLEILHLSNRPEDQRAGYPELLEYARTHGIPVRAINATRQQQRLLALNSRDELDEDQRAGLPTPGDTSPLQEDLLHRMFDQHPHAEDRDRFFRIQYLWEDAMAEGVTGSLEEFDDVTVLVLTGQLHVIYELGIPRRVEERSPHSYRTVLFYPGGEDPQFPEVETDRPVADFIWWLPEPGS